MSDSSSKSKDDKDPIKFARRVHLALQEQKQSEGKLLPVEKSVSSKALGGDLTGVGGSTGHPYSTAMPKAQTKDSLGGILGGQLTEWDKLSPEEQRRLNEASEADLEQGDAEEGVRQDQVRREAWKEEMTKAERERIMKMSPEEVMDYRNAMLWKQKEAMKNRASDEEQERRYNELNGKGRAAQEQQNAYLQRSLRDKFLPDFYKVRQANQTWDMEGRTDGANADEYVPQAEWLKTFTKATKNAQQAGEKALKGGTYERWNDDFIRGSHRIADGVAQAVSKPREPTTFVRGDDSQPAPDGTDFGDLIDKAIQNAKRPQGK